MKEDGKLDKFGRPNEETPKGWNPMTNLSADENVYKKDIKKEEEKETENPLKRKKSKEEKEKKKKKKKKKEKDAEDDDVSMD